MHDTYPGGFDACSPSQPLFGLSRNTLFLAIRAKSVAKEKQRLRRKKNSCEGDYSILKKNSLGSLRDRASFFRQVRRAGASARSAWRAWQVLVHKLLLWHATRPSCCYPARFTLSSACPKNVKEMTPVPQARKVNSEGRKNMEKASINLITFIPLQHISFTHQ